MKSTIEAPWPNMSPEILNSYLAQGHGRGRLISGATVYDGKVGYFCVVPIEVEGVQQDVIVFACMPHEDIVVTAFRNQSEARGMSKVEAQNLYDQSW